jgi:hypothetical protein
VRALLIAALVTTVSLELPAQKADRPNPTYDAVLKGLMCKQQQTGEMDCSYDVGKSLRFVISGVGQPDAAITFFKVDHDDDYYAGVTALHGCVVVKPVKAAADSIAGFAFVSPQTGKVYRDWQSCHKGGKPGAPPAK